MLTGATSKEETRSILNRLTQTATVKGKFKVVDQGQPEIKLVYVTVRSTKIAMSCPLLNHIA